jgi:hypothetical protein
MLGIDHQNASSGSHEPGANPGGLRSEAPVWQWVHTGEELCLVSARRYCSSKPFFESRIINNLHRVPQKQSARVARVHTAEELVGLRWAKFFKKPFFGASIINNLQRVP